MPYPRITLSCSVPCCPYNYGYPYPTSTSAPSLNPTKPYPTVPSDVPPLKIFDQL